MFEDVKITVKAGGERAVGGGVLVGEMLRREEAALCATATVLLHLIRSSRAKAMLLLML